MKRFFFLALLFFSYSGQARMLICEIRRVGDPSNPGKVSINLEEKLKDTYPSEKGVQVDSLHYSFFVEPKLDGNKLTIHITFTENKVEQNEVDQRSWEINLSRAPNSKILISEPLHEEGEHILDFVCWLK